MEKNISIAGQAPRLAEQALNCSLAPKWAALINDEFVSAPQRAVRASVLLAQAGAKPGLVLVRDHGGEQDVTILEGETVDLAQGNVFYLVSICEAPAACRCVKAPKLALFVDDRPEVTFNAEQTGKTIRELFGLVGEVHLLRDYESPHDELVGLMDAAPFGKGPVFITRRQHVELRITVNSKKFTEADGVKKRMTGRQIARLVTENPDATEVFQLKQGRPEVVPLDKEIPIQNCDEFRVIRKNVAGGFEISRIEREMAKLAEAGCRVEFIQRPLAAVIYRDVPTRPGYPHLAKTDVLVAVPNGYPGVFIDGAFLPQGSPLLGRVAGSPQGVIQAAEAGWQLVSYHPHKGGGGPPWNKDRHGFHTYFDEILCWIHRANN